MEQEKKEFIARHKIKEHHQDQFNSVKLAKDQTVISLPSKRGRPTEDAEGENEPLVKDKSGKGKKDKKDKKNKRFKA